MKHNDYGVTAWQIHEMVMNDCVACYQDTDLPTNSHDIRYNVFDVYGKKGIRKVTGEILVPALFDDIPEDYNCVSQIDATIHTIPVVKDKKFALYLTDGNGSLVTEFIYDNMYFFFYTSGIYYVVEREGKKGLIRHNGEEIVSCEVDEFYEQIDIDGIIPFRKGQKWGLLHFGVVTDIIFDDVEIESECYAKGKIGDDWFFINGDGKPVKNYDEAWFGSLYDSDK